jgi:hypothetical protein
MKLLFLLLLLSNIIVFNNETVIVGPSILPADNCVEAGHPVKYFPAGYVILPDKEKTVTISKVAYSLLGGKFGTMTPFQIEGHCFLARVEPHYHPYPPASLSEKELSKWPKPWGYHKGVTIYKRIGDKI